MRLRGIAVAFLGCTCGVFAASTLAQVPATPSVTPVTASVTWRDAQGVSAAAAFQGTVTAGALDGELKGKDGVVLVRGTLAADGSVSGVLTSAAGAPDGAFQAVRVAERFEGTYSVTGGLGGEWSAPADAVPGPAPATP